MEWKWVQVDRNQRAVVPFTFLVGHFRFIWVGKDILNSPPIISTIDLCAQGKVQHPLS